MSSFKRKGLVKQVNAQIGTRVSPASPLTIITSTGIPSLDDILGGGLPLSCSLLVAAPDYHSSYGDLVQKYFIAQGLKVGHHICVIGDGAEEFVRDIMWIPQTTSVSSDTLEDDEEQLDNQKIKIAWRYEQMKPFQTTVSSVPSYSTDEFCHTFDLSGRVPFSVIQGAIQLGRLFFISAQIPPEETSTAWMLNQITNLLEPEGVETSSDHSPLRICIPALGSPYWGELTDLHILHFLHSLRSILRRHPYACASINLTPDLSTDSWGGSGWIQKLGWVTDAVLTLSAFSADPSLVATFPKHHGLLHIHTLPAPHTLLPPSDRFSTLRGLSASASTIGGGENNITFKSTRKRLIFETLHLDVEGGVGERRTTLSALDTTNEIHDHGNRKKEIGLPAMEVALEDLRPEPSLGGIDTGGKVTGLPDTTKKPKKQVAFRTDRPDW